MPSHSSPIFEKNKLSQRKLERSLIMQTTISRTATTIATLRVLVVVESLAFLLWAPLHMGVELPLGFITLAEPRIVPAFIVETLCGLVLAASAYALYTRKPWAWSALVGAHIFAFLGVLLGITALALGRGPRTLSNDIYHTVLIILFTVSLILLRMPTVRSALAHAGSLSRHI
jgi:hypothetical protein